MNIGIDTISTLLLFVASLAISARLLEPLIGRQIISQITSQFAALVKLIESEISEEPE